MQEIGNNIMFSRGESVGILLVVTGLAISALYFLFTFVVKKEKPKRQRWIFLVLFPLVVFVVLQIIVPASAKTLQMWIYTGIVLLLAFYWHKSNDRTRLEGGNVSMREPKSLTALQLRELKLSQRNFYLAFLVAIIFFLSPAWAARVFPRVPFPVVWMVGLALAVVVVSTARRWLKCPACGGAFGPVGVARCPHCLVNLTE